MTGSSKMDNSTCDSSACNGLTSCDSAVSISSGQNVIQKESDASIATLDVTSEEITPSSYTWKHLSHPGLSSSVNEKYLNEDTNIVERRRSETWTFGVSNKTTKKNTNVFCSENAIGSPKMSTTEHLKNTSEYSMHSHKSVTNHNRDRVSHLSLDEINLGASNPGVSDVSFNTTHTSVKKTSLNSNILPCDNYSDQDFRNAMISNETLQTEFTDISLANGLEDCDSLSSMNDDVNTGARQLERKRNSLLGWISSSRNSSLASNSLQISPVGRDCSDSLENVSDPSGAMDQHQNRQPTVTKSSPGENGKAFGIKTLGQTLKSTLSSKNRFWRNNPLEPLSTTALILENRPSNLPSKSLEETEKHRQEYEKMVDEARKHEIKDLRKRKKFLQEQRKQEEAIAATSVIWTNEILPNWNAMSQTNRTRQLWWQGLPPSIRGKVWQLAIGNELNITEDLYNIMVTRAHEKLRTMNETQSNGGDDTESLAADRAHTVEVIRLDISRTFSHLCIFQKGGPYYDILHDILGAYACYRPDVGYVQGMSFVAAMLLLNLEPAEAFISFANLLNKPCQVAFFRLDEELMKTYFATFEVFFEENLPRLFAHFKQHNLTPDMYLIDWIFTMFSKALSLDTASRVWDVFCRDGEDFLFRTAIAILRMHEDMLLDMEFIHAAQFLTRLPASDFTHQQLFDHVTNVIMVSRGNRRWKDVLSLMKDAT